MNDMKNSVESKCDCVQNTTYDEDVCGWCCNTTLLDDINMRQAAATCNNSSIQH